MNHPPVHQIELRVGELGQLFNSMDPTPFHHRDLDPAAEEFIESWALEFPRESHFRIIVHLERMPSEDPTPLVAEAIHNYFDYKAVLARRSLRVQLIEGRSVPGWAWVSLVAWAVAAPVAAASLFRWE